MKGKGIAELSGMEEADMSAEHSVFSWIRKAATGGIPLTQLQVQFQSV